MQLRMRKPMDHQVHREAAATTFCPVLSPKTAACEEGKQVARGMLHTEHKD